MKGLVSAEQTCIKSPLFLGLTLTYSIHHSFSSKNEIPFTSTVHFPPINNKENNKKVSINNLCTAKKNKNNNLIII